MTHLRLSPPIPLDTPHGPGYAHILIDRGQEHHLEWVVFIDSSGECRTVQNPLIRLQKNETMGIRAVGKGPSEHIRTEKLLIGHEFRPGPNQHFCIECGHFPSEHAPARI